MNVSYVLNVFFSVIIAYLFLNSKQYDDLEEQQFKTKFFEVLHTLEQCQKHLKDSNNNVIMLKSTGPVKSPDLQDTTNKATKNSTPKKNI